ncbi:MAG: S8 family serine peptidase [Bacteriovoracia bacterium]
MLTHVLNRKQVRAIVGALVPVFMSGCFSDCKMLIQPPNKSFYPMVESVPAPVGQGDPLASEQWSIAKLGLTQAWTQSQGSHRIRVALIGTGVDYNHPDLRANIAINSEEAVLRKPGVITPADGIDNDGNGYIDDVVGYDVVDDHGFPYDSLGTGTAAAGVIAAVHGNGLGIRGIAPKVSLIPVRYIGPNGQTKVPNLVRALNYAHAVRPDVVYLHVANIQWSEEKEAVVKTEQAALKAALTQLRTINVPVVVSAGNSGVDLGKFRTLIREFAEFDNVVVVTSVGETDGKPTIANFGQSVHLAAPGEQVITTLPGGAYGKQSGTSIAAAHVAGTLALALADHHGQYTTQQLLQKLTSEAGADSVAGLEGLTLGGARLNVAKFLGAL